MTARKTASPGRIRFIREVIGWMQEDIRKLNNSLLAVKEEVERIDNELNPGVSGEGDSA